MVAPEVAGIVSDPDGEEKSLGAAAGYPAPPTRAGCKDWDWGERQFCTKGAVITVWIAGELAAGKPHFAPTIHSHITVHHSGELLHDEYMGIEQGVGVLRSFRIGDAIQAGESGGGWHHHDGKMAGGDMNALHKHQRQLWLLRAVGDNDLEAIRGLVGGGVCPSSAALDKLPPLLVAIQEGRPRAVKLLLALGGGRE